MRKTKASLEYGKKIVIHHVIPKSCIISVNNVLNFSINKPENLIFMPKDYTDRMTTPLIHVGPHLKYNTYVSKELLTIHTQEQLCDFILYLRYSLNSKYPIIPWN